MKPATHIAIALITVPGAMFVFGQGNLSPTGAPAPTMKRLDEVEARTIVNAANTPGNGTNTFIISAPGSYYLTGNLTGASGKHGISIQANDVTLDLNGFALISGGGADLRGVDTPSRHHQSRDPQRQRAGMGRRRGVCHVGHRAWWRSCVSRTIPVPPA